MAIRHASDHCAQANTFSLPGQKCERAVALQHFQFDGALHPNLKKVVHHGNKAESSIISRPCHCREAFAQRRRATRPRKVWDMQTDVHNLARSSPWLK